MGQWNVYFSGILYGKIREDGNGLLLQKRLPGSGGWGGWIPFTDEEDKEFSVLCSRSILSFFHHKKEYDEGIFTRPESFTTEGGETFTRRRKDSYFQRFKTFPMDLFYDTDGICSVLMSGRDYTAVLVKKGMERRTVLADWEKIFPGATQKDGEYQPGPVFAVETRGTFMVPTRDGEKLAKDVYLPGGSGQDAFPTILVRTPYGRGSGKEFLPLCSEGVCPGDSGYQRTRGQHGRVASGVL